MSSNWPIVWPGGGEPPNVDEAIIETAIDYAVTVLRTLTLGRVGVEPVTVMPCPETCALRRRTWIAPTLISGRVYNAACGCDRGCGCSSVSRVTLPAPVTRVDEVRVDGVVLDPSAYHVENEVWLVRTDGERWPACQGDQFTVTYLNAYPPGTIGAVAAGVLADEFVRSLTGGKCRLPSGVTSVTRQGISMEIASGMFPEGTTGIREVDTFIRIWNPNTLMTVPTVMSPDLPRARQITWRP